MKREIQLSLIVGFIEKEWANGVGEGIAGISLQPAE